MSTTDLLPHLIDLKALAAATEARLGSLEKHIADRMDNQDYRMNSHGVRLRSLEKTSWRRGGAVAAASAFVAAIITLAAAYTKEALS